MSDSIVSSKTEGLSEAEIGPLQKEFGKNVFSTERSGTFFTTLREVVTEPMFLILIAACTLYFILGKASEGIMMFVAIVIVTAISLFQEYKSNIALRALRTYTDPGVTVVRDGVEKEIPSEELVPGDVVILEEGCKIQADAVILHQNDLTIDESILTGESVPVEKNSEEGTNLLFQGTLLNTGKCTARITATGNHTKLGKLGKSVNEITTPPTQLQQQINRFVKRLALFGFCGFLVVCVVNYLHNNDLVESLLLGLALAMSVIPEEIPVAFSSFMALGAYHLARNGIITRHPVTIENLGAVTVLCLDKTGTITQNLMEVKSIYDFNTKSRLEADQLLNHGNEVLRYALLASETKPFDAMEKAIAIAYQKHTAGELISSPLTMVNEYPLSGRPPMMTHLYDGGQEKIVAAKGALERILQVCKLPAEVIADAQAYSHEMTSKGYRLLGVAGARFSKTDNPPANQDDFGWEFKGILSLYDPPKENVSQVLNEIYCAGIRVKILTGDYPDTVMSIAKQTGIQDCAQFITGEEVMKLEPGLLKTKVKSINIFARMFPEAKLKVIEALKEDGEITAMTGDGVNDGPALKAANIGIAMGKKGSEIARQAADLILTDDDMGKVLEGVRQGRKIFNNLKKATRYIVSIHIPIMMIASVPLLLGWKFANILTPIHVIFLELIMGPTCSIFFEREPVEANLMSQPPRQSRQSMFEKGEIIISGVQGLVIAAAILTTSYFLILQGFDLPYTRTVLFTTLIISNVFLTLADRSFTETIFKTIHYPNNLRNYIFLFPVVLLALLHFVPWVRSLFELVTISAFHFLIAFLVGFGSVMWFEVYKGVRNVSSRWGDVTQTGI